MMEKGTTDGCDVLLFHDFLHSKSVTNVHDETGLLLVGSKKDLPNCDLRVDARIANCDLRLRWLSLARDRSIRAWDLLAKSELHHVGG